MNLKHKIKTECKIRPARLHQRRIGFLAEHSPTMTKRFGSTKQSAQKACVEAVLLKMKSFRR